MVERIGGSRRKRAAVFFEFDEDDEGDVTVRSKWVGSVDAVQGVAVCLEILAQYARGVGGTLEQVISTLAEVQAECEREEEGECSSE